MIVLRNLAFYLVFYGGTALCVLGALIASLAGRRDELRAVVSAWSGLHRWCVTRLLGIAIVQEGAPSATPALYAIRHESFFEAIDAPSLFDTPVPFAKAELLEIPGWGQAARAYGLIPVARDRGASALRTMLRAARVVVAEGRPLVIFPEGTRTPHGRAAPLKSGFAGLYKMLGLPVVPVAVDSGPLYHRAWKRRGRITYRFGEAIPPGLGRDELEARVSAAIGALDG